MKSHMMMAGISQLLKPAVASIVSQLHHNPDCVLRQQAADNSIYKQSQRTSSL